MISLIKEKKGVSLMNEKNLTPLVIFPKGTTTSGKHLMSFKKGEFASLLQNSLLFLMELKTLIIVYFAEHLMCSLITSEN